LNHIMSSRICYHPDHGVLLHGANLFRDHKELTFLCSLHDVSCVGCPQAGRLDALEQHGGVFDDSPFLSSTLQFAASYCSTP
jgi:hypothetical protein